MRGAPASNASRVSGQLEEYVRTDRQHGRSRRGAKGRRPGATTGCSATHATAVSLNAATGRPKGSLTCGGFFYPLVKPGDPVGEGTPLARIVDVYGDEVEVLRSPSSGAIALGIQEFPVVATGSWVAELGILVPE